MASSISRKKSGMEKWPDNVVPIRDSSSFSAGYRDLVDNARIGLFRTNLKGDILYINKCGLAMLGLENLDEAKPGDAVAWYRNPEDRKTFLERLGKTGRIDQFEAECVTAKGETVVLLVNAVLEGDVITGAMIDISALKRQHEALIRREKRLADAQRIAHLGCWDWDIVTGELFWSDEVYRIFGLRPQEFGATYDDFLARIHPDDRRTVEERVNLSLADPGIPYSVSHRILLPDRAECEVFEKGEVTFDGFGKPVRMIGTVHRLRMRKQTEEELARAYEEIQALKEKLEAENTYLREEVGLQHGAGEIIGDSEAIRNTLHRALQVARTSVTVLLTGETGTGKGVFAHFLHQNSGRADKPFVHVNCAGLPHNLIESELFGREKGAFTGSTARQIGRFELAHGGTIFLDEIGELPLELQAKLLRVIEDGEFERLGSPHSIKVDSRIITSTNRDLEDEISEGRFREDLFFRLSVFPIVIPPLRERKADIPLLVEFFTHKCSKVHRKNIRHIPAQTMKSLESYGWPGNVRELMNVIERAVIVTQGTELQLAGQLSARSIRSRKERGIEGSEKPAFKGLNGVERRHILETLQEAGWKIEGPGGAAQRLEMNPSTLRTRMKKLQIKRPETL